MKKICCLALLLTILISPVLAQSNLSVDNEQAKPEPKRFFKHRLAQLRAEENFMKENKNAVDVRWFDDPNGFFVYYKKEGKKAKSFYNKNGHFIYSAMTYTEHFMPVKIRRLVKSVYYMDFKITHVNEIRQDDRITYLVMITDDQVWKKLRITDGEMEEIKEYTAR